MIRHPLRDTVVRKELFEVFVAIVSGNNSENLVYNCCFHRCFHRWSCYGSADPLISKEIDFPLIPEKVNYPWTSESLSFLKIYCRAKEI